MTCSTGHTSLVDRLHDEAKGFALIENGDKVLLPPPCPTACTRRGDTRPKSAAQEASEEAKHDCASSERATAGEGLKIASRALMVESRSPEGNGPPWRPNSRPNSFIAEVNHLHAGAHIVRSHTLYTVRDQMVNYFG